MLQADARTRRLSGLTRQGFTLIELLVAIAIIAILAAILFPSFGRARENSKRTVCQNSLHQLGLAFLQYTQDFDERLPGAVHGSGGATREGGWIYFEAFGGGGSAAFDVKKGSLFTYVKSEQVYVCPTDDIGQVTGLTYAINSCVGQNRNNSYYLGKKLSSFRNTSQWMLLGEETMDPDDFFNSTDDGFLSLSAQNRFATRHFNGSNLLLLDGHVKWFPNDKILADGYQIGGTGLAVPGTNDGQPGGCP